MVYIGLPFLVCPIVLVDVPRRMCMCRACRIQYDDTASRCLLSLLHSSSVVALRRGFVTTLVYSLVPGM